ncbi:MAG TPA: hypothetical protein VGH95_00980 [Candidatus Aquirickettsiella sp.]|jgi:hypothetical protein
MPTSYVFDTVLNLDKCLQNTPPSTLQIDDLPQLPKNWLIELENQCRKIKPNLEKNIFLNHIGSNSKYKLKAVLLKQLSFIFYQISGHLYSELLHHDSSHSLLIGLIEDIKQCTPGFHIRVNKLVNSLQVPDTLEQLLYLVRKNIVQEIACNLTSSVPSVFQVHVVDRVCRIAKKQGLGIEPNIQKDPYKSFLSGKTIREHLQSKFPQHYTPFKIPFLLAEQLQLILSLFDYQGPKKDYYKSEAAENIVSIIKKFFLLTAIQKMHFKDFFICQLDQFDDPTLFYDIDWPLIRQFFFQQLIGESYFTDAPEPTNLIEYAYFQTLLPEKTNFEIENRFINDYLESQNYARLLDDLTFIQTDFSKYWPKLIKNPIIIKNIDKFFEYLRNQSQDLNAKEQLKRVTLTYTLFFSQTKEYILSKIVNDTELNLRIINNNLLFKSMRYHPEIIEELLNIFLKKYNNQPRFFFNLLFEQNSEGSNLLMLAARYHPQTLQQLLFILNKQHDHYERKEVLALFLSHNQGWNLFSLAAKYQTDAMQYIFDFLSKNPHYFCHEILRIIFHQKNNSEWNFLQLLVRYQSEDQINSCLDFISEMFQFSNNKKWIDIILNNKHTEHLLRLATRSNKSALNSILNFMSEHIKQIDFYALQHCFSAPNNKGWHCLHNAACSNSSNLKLILEFIQKHINQFNINALKDLFLAQNQAQENFLLLAVHYQSAEAVGSIFKFLNQQIKFFDNASLQQLFLQQNSNGWNLLSMSHLQPTNIKLILDFINQHPDNFDAETIKKIILQKNKNDYTCLHYAARFQPDSLEIILDFIDKRLALFVNELKLLFENPSKLQLITTLFRKPTSKSINLLEFSLKYQQESAAHFSKFLNTHADKFNLEKNYLKNFINQATSKALLDDEDLKSVVPRIN